jgi:hypothetical protein
MSNTAAEAWDSGHAYEQYVGRWSRKVASELVRWLALAPGLAWADVGCGTGALAETIITSCAAASVRAMDLSASFVAQVRQRDYSGGMQMIRHFWDVAVAVSPSDARLDQAERFPLCQPQPLQALFERARLKSVAVRAIEIPTVFRDFEDYWTPFLGKTGAAPTYLASVGADVREGIRRRLEARLASTPTGSIELTARAWAVQGVA